MRNLLRKVPFFLLGLLLVLATPDRAEAQQFANSQTSFTEQNLPEGHSPRGALWRSAVLPGWGQYYNREYWKIPIVYIGLAGIAGTAVYTGQQYLLFRNAYRYVREPENYPEYEEQARRFQDLIDAGREDILQQERERFRRFRDISIMGTVAFYGFAMLDAYVSAHLLDFDIDEDLSIRVSPSPEGATFTLSYTP